MKVAARPRIAIVATGDELVTGDRALAPHEIRSSNAPALAGALIAHGWGEPSLLHLPDARDELARGLERALEQHDLLIVSGGVSKGRFDYVPEVLEAAGIRARFHGVRQRPGKPMWFGSRRQDQKVVFALPGNPVSALVCMHRYVLPALAHAAGHTGGERSVALAQTEHFTPALTWFLPVRLARNEQGAQMAESRTANTSGDFVGLAHTDGFVELPAGESEFPAGYVARYFSWLPA